jgi:tetratricopeptide (TPR) repeat protein
MTHFDDPEKARRYLEKYVGDHPDIAATARLILRIENEYIPPCSQATVELIDKSLDILSRGPNDSGNQSEATPYLEQAIEMEPDCAMALHNLGALYMNLGRLEEGEALIRRSVAVDPNYLFAFTTLAQLELRNKNYKACKDHIEHILSASSIPFNVIQRAFEIQVRLGVAEQNLKGAKTALQMLKEFLPDDPKLP